MIRKSDNGIQSSAAIERLTALWALSESGLGGILHALKIPLSGIIVGGFAVILISFIGYFAEKKFTSIVKATIVVLLVKLAASPHSPLQAYFAVSFQGILGAIIFDNTSHFKIGTMLLAVAGLLESAVQKLLILTIIYGTSFWKAINVFYKNVAGEFSIKSTSLSGSEIIIISYLGIYLICGIVVGWIAGKFPGHILSLYRKDESVINLRSLSLDNKAKLQPFSIGNQKRNIFKPIIMTVLIILLMIPFSISEYGFLQGIYLFLRVIILISLWYFLLSPFLMKLLGKLLKKQSKVYFNDVDNIVRSLPLLKNAAKNILIESIKMKGIKRFDYFISTLVLFSLTYNFEDSE